MTDETQRSAPPSPSETSTDKSTAATPPAATQVLTPGVVIPGPPGMFPGLCRDLEAVSPCRQEWWLR